MVVGDLTDHAGIVVSGSLLHTIDGRAIARLGDRVDCPRKFSDGSLHDINEIIEAESRLLIDGIPVALEGQRTACGGRLIGTVLAAYG